MGRKYFRKKGFGSHYFLGGINLWGSKFVWVIKAFGIKIFWGSLIFRSQTCLGSKILQDQRFWGVINFSVSSIFGGQNIHGYKILGKKCQVVVVVQMPKNLCLDWLTWFMKVILLGLSLVRTNLK